MFSVTFWSCKQSLSRAKKSRAQISSNQQMVVFIVQLYMYKSQMLVAWPVGRNMKDSYRSSVR